jgi:hypothetical protein
MALVMAIGISFVLAILGASVILFTTSNEGHSSRQTAATKAYTVAQAGIDSAAAQLGGASYANRINPAFFTSMPAADRTTTIDTGSVTWTGQLINDSFVSTPDYRWHLTATASVPNPTSPGNNLTRTLQADLRLVPRTFTTTNNAAWRYVYSTSNDNNPNTCDQTIRNNPGVVSSFYVNGDLCLDNASNMYGPLPGDPEVEVVVHGRSYLNHPSTSIGTVTRPVTRIWSDLGCDYRGNGAHTPCTPIDRVWPISLLTPSPIVTAPTANYNDWYHLAKPGPAYACGGGSFGPVPTFETPSGSGAYPNRDESAGTSELTPSSSYSCVLPGGKLAWIPASVSGLPYGQLTVDGTVYIDGNVELSSQGVIKYTGFGAIYLTGSYRQRQTIVCAQLNASNSGCDPAWTNSANNVLLIVAGGKDAPAQPGAGMSFEQSSGFQGALFAEEAMTFENNTWVQGPMIAKRQVIENAMYFNYIPLLVNVPFGAPGTVITEWELTGVQHHSG